MVLIIESVFYINNISIKHISSFFTIFKQMENKNLNDEIINNLYIHRNYTISLTYIMKIIYKKRIK